MESALREALAPERQPAAAPATAAPAVQRPRLSISLIAAAAVLVALVAGLIVWTRRPAVSAVPVRTLAVLPLATRPAQAASQIGDAVTEKLIDTLSQVQSLRTTSVTSVLPFKQSDRPRLEIAKLLGVDAVLDGVLTVVDGANGGPGELRLDAKLIAAGSGAGVVRSGHAQAWRRRNAAVGYPQSPALGVGTADGRP